jgi:hypothetical protein
MEVIVKARVLLTSALLMFVQISAPQAQETADVSKVTCDQLVGERLATPSHDVVLWISGYYNGKRNNTMIDLQTNRKDEENVRYYCLNHRETSVMDAVKDVLGLDK